LVQYLKRNMTTGPVPMRILFTYAVFLIVFFAVTALSYFFLPQEFLQNKHPLQNWATSGNLVVSTLQIFSYNLVSVAVLLCGNIFSGRKNKDHCFMPIGYTAFFVLISINAVVLGTWSFSVVTEAVPLLDRFLRTFDLAHRAGLWEMSGQLFIVCATARISLVITDGKETTIKNWRTIKLSTPEIRAVIIGLLLMLTGAFIESCAIASSSIINP
jgi:hypothetical protein